MFIHIMLSLILMLSKYILKMSEYVLSWKCSCYQYYSPYLSNSMFYLWHFFLVVIKIWLWLIFQTSVMLPLSNHKYNIYGKSHHFYVTIVIESNMSVKIRLKLYSSNYYLFLGFLCLKVSIFLDVTIRINLLIIEYDCFWKYCV